MSISSNPQARGIFGRLLSIRRRTWIILSLLFLTFVALLIWATISIAGWLFGIARDGAGAAPEALQAAAAQVEQVVPGVQEKLGALLPALRSPPALREVSGSDPAPVPRYPGMLRVQWQDADGQVTVRYQGEAALPEVIRHYVEGFTAQGYRQQVLTATPEQERHAFVRDNSHFSLVFSATTGGQVTVDLPARKPATAMLHSHVLRQPAAA